VRHQTPQSCPLRAETCLARVPLAPKAVGVARRAGNCIEEFTLNFQPQRGYCDMKDCEQEMVKSPHLCHEGSALVLGA
jgi:hypothetical protein